MEMQTRTKLPFLSKVLKKHFFFCNYNHIWIRITFFERFRSGFRTRHSTEWAILKVQSDILLSLDSKQPVQLVILDLTAAFDTVDHAVLLTHLTHQVGLQGPVLQWFKSFLAGRSFSVMINDLSSSSVPLSYGVPQGSILGPVLFSLCCAWAL